MSAEYIFVDEWDVDAPIAQVFQALSDVRTYPLWWRPVYLSVEADGPPRIGLRSQQRFKGRLPYELTLHSEVVALDPPRRFEVRADGDLSGRGVWTLSQTSWGVHVHFDWRVSADRPLLRILTPLLRPLFRWNHAWAVARAMEGLGPYARRLARQGTSE
jgi:hypothetical protein